MSPIGRSLRNDSTGNERNGISSWRKCPFSVISIASGVRFPIAVHQFVIYLRPIIGKKRHLNGQSRSQRTFAKGTASIAKGRGARHRQLRGTAKGRGPRQA